MPNNDLPILTINGGSSSIKFALFSGGQPPARLLAGQVERIGLPDTRLTFREADKPKESQSLQAPTSAEAVQQLLDWLAQRVGLDAIRAVGHRVVHGGPHYLQPLRVTPELLAELRRITFFDPEHLPGEIALIAAFQERCPVLPQIVCFDTTFHAAMPREAQMLALPRKYEAQGVRRYGFHGLSYAYLMEELAKVAGEEAANARVILAHLGNGASMAAVRNGQSVDTTMGFTPTAGLPMSTRSGDIDPGLVCYLARTEGMTAEQFQELVNRHAGLLGISETSPDMRDLLARRAGDPRAAEAVAFFCYQARKWIGGFSAILGGLDTLVFSGGIGENAPEVRAGICAGLDFLGVTLDAAANAANAPVISAPDARVNVRVIRTDEEALLARTVLRILAVKE